MTVGDVITVSGISKKGKNRVREHGNTWTVIKTTDKGALLEAPDKYWRWLELYNDPDFKVESRIVPKGVSPTPPQEDQT